MKGDSGYDHAQVVREFEDNVHRFTFEFECPAYSTKTRHAGEHGASEKLDQAVVCDHLIPLLGGLGHGFWPSGEPLTAGMVAFTHVLAQRLIEEPGDFDVVGGFCTHPALPERICICRTWGRCTDA